MKNNKLIWITQTALLIALIVLAQLLSKVIPPFVIGVVPVSQFVTGSLVNLVLIIGAYMTGMSSAGTAALISPVLAAFFGIIPGHFVPMVPVVMAGNLVIVFITWLCFRASNGLSKNSSFVLNVLGIGIGALLKCAVMWSATSKIIVPMFKVSKKAAPALVAAVSAPQFITAAIGGVLALLIIPTMRSFKKRKR